MQSFLKITKSSIHKVFLLLTGIFLFAGGVNPTNFFYYNLLFILLSLLFLFYIKRSKPDFKLPQAITEYKVFLAVFLITFFWSKNFLVSLYFFSIFVTGGLVWLISYNFKKELENNFLRIIIFLGFIFLGLYLTGLITQRLPANSLSLFLPTTTNRSHNHLGDFWILPLLIIFQKWMIRRESVDKKLLLVVVAGVFALFVSMSRSALVALGTGLILLIKTNSRIPRKFLMIAGLLVVAAIFIYSGLGKPIFSARPYFTQAINSFPDNLYGVGYGNFGYISLSVKDLKGEFSSYTHNFVLEMIVGFGVYSIVFFYWLFRVLKDAFIIKNRLGIYGILFIALTVNFMFDFTYAIPTLLWIWFALIGIIQKRADEKVK